ncbi:hypothetical protein sortkaff_60 [Escherichia phage sortkaff]|uniref:Uncharacterized protein n=1 Tax=Escherichia phage sortkaff TaxID=2696445 RepID=A0A6C0R0F7_9CAUD|nr:hypothetical protein sortkaff_60 [Escherichia phage sortkaff]
MSRKNKLPPDTIGRFDKLGIEWFLATPYPYLVCCIDPQNDAHLEVMDQALENWRDPAKPCQSGRATAYVTDDAYVAIVQIKRSQHWRAVVAHEVVHIKNFIADDFNITWGPENDEPEAYLVGALFTQIERAYEGLGYGKKS